MNPFPDTTLLVPRTLFGRGKLALLPASAREFGGRGVLAHGASFRQSGALDRLQAALPPSEAISFWEHEGGEPTLEQADALRARAAEARAEWIAAIGGGSVMDLAKTAAGLFHETALTAAFHGGRPVAHAGLPLIAVPTTAGTGAEATPNAVLTDSQTMLKKSIRDDRFMAKTVILDPDLLAGTPPCVIAQAGMDAYTQALESFVSSKSSRYSDALALEAIGLIAGALPAVFKDSAAPPAGALLAGSHLAGIALSVARLGVVHGIAHPLGAFYHQPHGLVCAVCLPEAIALNRPAMGEKYDRLSTALGGDLLAQTRRLLDRLEIGNPFKGMPLLRKNEIVEQTLSSGSTLANPKTITPRDVDYLLERLFA
jgi:alcohol dehydrogenase class IV